MILVVERVALLVSLEEQLHQLQHLVIIFAVIMIVIHQPFVKKVVEVVVRSIDFEIKVSHQIEVRLVEQVLKVMIHH